MKTEKKKMKTEKKKNKLGTEKTPKAVEEVKPTPAPVSTPEVPTIDEIVDTGSSKIEGFNVSNPLELRPKELPLVVKAPKEGWANKAQEYYSKIVNAYAYKNPTKWDENRFTFGGVEIPNSAKKFELIKQLKELGKNPKLLIRLTGDRNILDVLDGKDIDSKTKFSNKLIER